MPGGVNEDDDASHNIPGNAPVEVKALVRNWLFAFKEGFGMRSVKGLDLVEVSIVSNVDEPSRRQARVVLETTVTQDMLNVGGKMHGACTVHLVDICTTLPISAMSFADGGAGSAGVSQNINVIFHAPASLQGRHTQLDQYEYDDRVTDGGVDVVPYEIWDKTHRRLVASATQVKMEPSSSKL